jgi:KilA-N domain
MQLTYNDHTIDQRDDSYVNLSQMAKANNVRLNKYFESVETKRYLEAAQNLQSPESGQRDLTQVTGTNRKKQTWGHPLVALHFGQWISPEFHVWCNQNIHTLITTGTANLNPDTTRLEQALLQTQQQLSQLTGLVTTLASGSKPKATKTKKSLKADLNHPNPEIKEILTRTKVRKLINSYCYLTNQNYRNVYQHLYEQYNLRYNYDVYAQCAKTGQTCKLTQMEQDKQLDRFHQMVTALTLEQAA